MDKNDGRVVSNFIMQALKGDDITVYGDGKQMRDWLYVKDNCAAIDLVAQKGEAGGIYNIASGEERMNLELARDILKLLKKPEKLIKPVADRPGHDRRYSLSIARITSLGWKPKVGFDQGLERTISWYLDNPRWWQPLLKDCFFKTDTPWRG